MRAITFATFATLLLVTSGMIGSGHIALAHNSKDMGMFSNSGNNQDTQQSCGNSCTVSSSNVITQGAASTTTPSPNNMATVLNLIVRNVTKTDVSVVAILSFQSNGDPVTATSQSGITITFTGTGVPPNLAPTVQTGNEAVFFVTFKPPTTSGTYTVQAHFAGLEVDGETLLPSDSQITMFTVP